MSNAFVTDSAVDRVVALQVAGLVLLPDGSPRLYARRAGDAFSRDTSVQGMLVLMDDAVALDFTLPTGAIDYLRFELPAVPGCYRMGPVVIDGRMVDDLARRVMLVHGRRLPDMGLASGIRLADWSGAPSFEMDVRDLLGAGGQAEATAVRVTIRKEHAAIEIERQLDVTAAVMAQQLEAHGRALRDAMDDAAASVSLAQLAAHDRLHAELLEVHARIKGASTDVLKVHKRIDRLGAETAQSLSTQADGFRQELAVLRQHLDAVRSQLDFLTQYELNRSFVRRALRKVKRVFWK